MIFHLRSLDHGATWSSAANLSRIYAQDTTAISPSVAVSGAKAHVVWSDRRDGNWEEIYYRRNPYGNETSFWDCLTDSSSGRHLARETWFGNQNLHLVMGDGVHVSYTKSTDGGVGWMVPQTLGYGQFPSVGLVELPLDVYPPWYAVCVVAKHRLYDDSLAYWMYNPSLGVWQYWGIPAVTYPGPPSLVQDYYGNTYVAYRGGDGRIYCRCFPYYDASNSTVEVIDSNTNCSQPSLGMDGNGQPHATWRRGTDYIWYAPRAGGSWSPKEQIDQLSGLAQQPFAEGFAPYLYAVWSEGSGNGSEIYRGRKDLTSGDWDYRRVTTNSKASESPTWTTNEFATYSEGTSTPGDYNDIYYWRESSGNSNVVESNPNEWSYWPHCVSWSGWFWDTHLAVAWTERDNANPQNYRVLAKHLTPGFGGGGGEGFGPESGERGGYYKVLAGQDAPSPYCRKRDGVLRFADKAVDYANDSLVYELPYLDPKYDFLVKVSSYRETGNDWVQALSVDGKAARTLRFAPNKVDTAWIQIPPELYLKDRKVVFSLKNLKGDYVTNLGLGLYYYDHKQRGKGGGPQAGVPVELPVREVFAVYPNPAKGQTQIEYSLRAPGKVDLSVYDLTGRLVRKVVDASQLAGIYKVTWDGRDLGGRAVSSGVYFLKLTSPGKAKTARVVLVR